MAGIDKILETIRRESGEREKEILSLAEAKAEAILDEARQQADNMMAREKQRVQKEAEQERVRHNAQDEAEMHQELLRLKRELLKACYQSASGAIESLPLPKYEAFLRFYLAGENLDGCELVLSFQDKKRLEKSGFLKQYMKKGLRLSKEEGQFSAGFMLKKKNFVVDCSLPALLEEKQEVLELKLAKILFEEGQHERS